MIEELDKLLRLHDRMIRAGIDASCCQTSRDWEKYHDLTEQYENAYVEYCDKLKVLK